jgi:hypothetical protein
MLVSFSVSNFRSFNEEQTFSLVASKRHTGLHQNHALPIPHSDESVLRAGVIYGANGAGKSNLFKALRFLRQIALDVRDKEEAIPLEPFLLNQTAGVSRLDLQFVCFENVYRYGVKLTDTQVDEEWLVRIVDGKEKIVFERITSEEGSVSVELGDAGSIDDSEFEKFAAMVKVGGPRNQTFLATVRSTLDVPSWPERVSDAIVWFSRLRLVSPGDPVRRNPSAFINDDDLLSFAGEFLNAAATGIDRLQVAQTTLSEEEIAGLVSAPIRQRLASAAIEGRAVRQVRPNGDVIIAEKIGERLQYSLVQLKAAHRGQNGEDIPFDIEQESDGTKRILELIPALHSFQQIPLCYFIDEIDRSLHPMLAREFVEFFFRSCQNRTAQLIMTTHESSLLDQDLLRRDEIWFAEKDQQGATKLYSLLDFAPRNDLDLRKNYLQGRFGAIPFLGGMERLLEKQQDPTGAKPE